VKIALVASVWISIPPKDFGFGAQEYIEYYIAEELTRRGHDVTLFASGDSKTSAKLIPVSDIQVSEMPTIDARAKDMFELMNLSKCFEMAGAFDIIHNHLLPYGLVFGNLTKTPIVHTLHHEIYKTRSDVYIYERYKNQSFISI
jgi:predicted peroxiredoxin